MKPEARVHYDAGMAAYAARDWARALHELDAAFALDPRREIVFAQAQAHRLDGDCAAALPLYRRFLDSGPSPTQAEAARLAMSRCTAAAPAGPTQPGPAPAAAPTSPASAPPSSAPAAPGAAASRGVGGPPTALAAAQPAPGPTPARTTGAGSDRPESLPRGSHDRTALALSSAAVVAVVAGTTLVAAAYAARDGAATRTTFGDYADRRDTASTRLALGAAALGVGVVLAAGATLRVVWSGHRDSGVSLAGHF